MDQVKLSHLKKKCRRFWRAVIWWFHATRVTLVSSRGSKEHLFTLAVWANRRSRRKKPSVCISPHLWPKPRETFQVSHRNPLDDSVINSKLHQATFYEHNTVVVLDPSSCHAEGDDCWSNELTKHKCSDEQATSTQLMFMLIQIDN